MVPFFPRSRGPAAASSLSMEGTTVDLEPGRADGRPLSILSMAANLGLCCHLIYFFSPDAHSVQCVQQHGVWERALDQEGQAETPSLFLLVLHKDWSCTLLTLLSFSHYSRRSHSLVGGRPRNNHHIMFQV